MAISMIDDLSALLASLPERIDAVPRAVAARTPDAPALAEADRTVTYAELVAAIDRHAGLLRAHGVRRGDRMLLVAENCIDQVALVFAASTVGAWAVNANARLSAPELDAIAAHSGARLALYTAAVSPEACAHGERLGARAHDGLLVGPTRDAAEPAADRSADRLTGAGAASLGRSASHPAA